MSAAAEKEPPAGPDNLVHRGVHVMGHNPPTRWPQVRSSEVPPGDKWFWTALEANDGRAHTPGPGPWRFTSVWCETPKARGAQFRPRTPVAVPVDEWVLVELRVKCNSSPDARDGEQALWIDGREAGRWGGFRWRTTAELNVNGVQLATFFAYVCPPEEIAKSDRVSRLWFDDVVVSKSYIGS